MSFLIGALSVMFAFGLVIFVHEFGHFIVAKRTGVRVDRFSFGLGPEMVGFQWGETRYCLAWIPLGGEVRMAGDMELEDAAAAPSTRDPREFFSQPWYRRIPIVVAGPAMNYVLAFVLFSLVSFVWGVPTPSPDPVVGEVADSYPAAQAGMKPGDRVLSIDGSAVEEWKQVADRIHAAAGKKLSMQVLRAGETLSLSVTPMEDKPSGRGLIGISPATVQERLGLGESLKRGVEQCWGWSKLTVVYLAEKIARREKPELSGPVGIASVVAKAAKAGPTNYLSLIALISVGIGLFNLFPIPMLDGGHMAFYLWEGISRRRVSRRIVQAANMAGLAALLSIFLFATYSDIQRLKAPSSEQSASPR